MVPLHHGEKEGGTISCDGKGGGKKEEKEYLHRLPSAGRPASPFPIRFSAGKGKRKKKHPSPLGRRKNHHRGG